MEKKITMFDLLDYSRVIYLNLNILTLICSYFTSTSFFSIYFTLIIIEKCSIIALTIRQIKKGDKTCFIPLMIESLLNIKYYKDTESTPYSNHILIKMIPYGASLIYDIIFIWYLFLNGALYSITNPFIAMVFIIQIIIGFSFKSVLLLLILIDIDQQAVSFTTLIQFTSIFLGILSLQGIGAFLLQNLTVCFCLLLWKILISYKESYIMMQRRYQLFGCDPSQPQAYWIIILTLFIHISNFPIDYAPFYDNSKLKNSFLDFKFTQVASQKSLTIIRAGQLLDSLLMLTIVKYFNFIPENEMIQIYYRLITIAISFNTCFSLYHIIDRYLEHKSNSYKYLSTTSVSYQDFKNIIQRSKSINLLEITRVDGIEELSCQNQSEQINQERKEIFNYLINIPLKRLQHINIADIYSVKNQNSIRINGSYFYEEVLDYIQNEKDIKVIELQLSKYLNNQLHFQQALTNRLFKFGVDNNLIEMIQYLDFDLKEACILLIKKYQVEVLRIIQFNKQIYEYFDINPQQIYYDLYETDLI